VTTTVTQLHLFAAPDVHSAAMSPAVASQPVTAAPVARRQQKLWICIRFPQLCLEALGCPQQSPAAIITEPGGAATVLACNGSAGQAGVAPGMSLNAALTLSPGLDIRQRKESMEAALLQARANWALAYTPVVSIDPAGALLLEVGSSLRLFGGLKALRERLVSDLSDCGQTALIASAPVAKAALWLARACREVDCSEPQELPGQLAGLPLACLAWPVSVQYQLLQMGIHTLGDCLRLPRAGFARRVGAGYLQELDQGFGQRPELLCYYQPPEVFSESLDLPAESLAGPELTGALRDLLDRLAIVMRRQQVSVQSLQVQLRHYGRSPTELSIAVREPSASAAYFLELTCLQLERQILPAPVTGVALCANLAAAYHVATGALPGTEVAADVSGATITHLVERLRARLGMRKVYSLELVAEHRPECAWRIAEPAAKASGQALPGGLVSRARPLWLFARPQRLVTRRGRPVYRGILEFSTGAERIESGWWDGNDIRRDYYAATDGSGYRCWIYRDCRDSNWYLHGLFG
jgi:protein ImuB